MYGLFVDCVCLGGFRCVCVCLGVSSGGVWGCPAGVSGVSRGVCVQEDVCLGVRLEGDVHPYPEANTPPWTTEWLTDRRRNITVLQLRLRVANIRQGKLHQVARWDVVGIKEMFSIPATSWVQKGLKIRSWLLGLECRTIYGSTNYSNSTHRVTKYH